METQPCLLTSVVWIIYNTEYTWRGKKIQFYDFRSYTDNSKELYFNLIIKWHLGI